MLLTLSVASLVAIAQQPCLNTTANFTLCTTFSFKAQCEAADNPGCCHWCPARAGLHASGQCLGNRTTCPSSVISDAKVGEEQRQMQVASGWQHETPIVFEEIRLEILLIIAENSALAPRFLRLAWHSSGTYSPFEEPQGGSNGATMRFEPENSYGANRGMQDAIDALGPIHARHASDISVSDLWIFAAYVAVEHLDGPVIGFTPGRTDATSGGENCPPEERLPTPDESSTGVREIFGRLGLDDREFVAIMGAHSVGRPHPEFSGFPSRHWDTTPHVLDNLYYGLLREPPAGVEWQEDFAVNPETGEQMLYFRSYSWLMLPVDMLLRDDPVFNPIMEEYARFENLEVWREDFGRALRKVTELGLEYNAGPEGGVRARAETDAPCPGRTGAAKMLRGGDGGCPFAKIKSTGGSALPAHKQHMVKPAGHP